jgi:hypothetical protein
MSLTQQIIDRVHLLDAEQQRRVLDFMRELEHSQDVPAEPSWTDEEIRQLMARKPTPRAEFIAWLDAHPPEEPWGDLKDDEDAGEYVHRMRRQSTIWLDEPGEDE